MEWSMEETFLISQLTHFSPVSHFHTPWKRQKTFSCDTGLKWVKNDMRTYNIGKIITGKGDYYKISCLLGYPYFKKVNRKT